MTSIGAAFLPQEEQNLASTRNLGDALARVATKVFGSHNTAKTIEGQWGLDRATAKNVLKGVVGAVPVTKAVRAQQDKHQNGWALWDALGELVIGESRHDYEERLLNQIIRERDDAHQTLVSLRARREALESRATDALDAFDRSLADQARDQERRTWREADQPSHRSPRRKSSVRKA